MIALRRIIKRLLYAVLGLGLLALFFFLVIIPYLDIFRRDPAPPPPVRESIIIESVATITHNATIDLIARVRNPNPRAGVADYSITFALLDTDGQEINVVSEPTYLLPGTIKYVVALDIAFDKQLSKVRVEQPVDPTFTAFNLDEAMPSFNSFLRERTIKTFGQGRYEVQKGFVTNTGNLGYRRVDIIGIGFDANNRLVGVGQTFISELQAGEQREFTLQWPKPFSDTAKVIILPDTNIYRADNILPVVGDPSRLRDLVTDQAE